MGKSIRQRFTENAEQFDALMVEMLNENSDLRVEIKRLESDLKNQRNQLLDDIKADFLAGIDNDTPEDMVIAIKACCVDLWKYRDND